MTELDRVIKGLETALQNYSRYSGDEYGREYDYARVEVDMLEDALALLKAQEPVFPHMVDWGLYECPKCKMRVDKTYKYCKCCGQAVKWE